MKKWITNVCLYSLKPWLEVHGSCEALASLTRGHGGVFTPNMQESLTMRWLCQHRWMLCRNAHRPVHTSTAGKTHTLLAQSIPQKWAEWATDPKVITCIPMLELSCLEGLHWCPLLPLSWDVTACYFPAQETAGGVGTRNPWPLSCPSHGLVIHACYTFSFKTDWQQGVAKHFVWEWSEKDFAGDNLHEWVCFNFLPFIKYSWNGFIFS